MMRLTCASPASMRQSLTATSAAGVVLSLILALTLSRARILTSSLIASSTLLLVRKQPFSSIRIKLCERGSEKCWGRAATVLGNLEQGSPNPLPEWHGQGLRSVVAAKVAGRAVIADRLTTCASSMTPGPPYLAV